MVGSLLRSERLKKARAGREEGLVTAAELNEIEDVEIAILVRKQEAVGLRAVTDGEFRRAFWHYDFLEGLDGVEGFELEQGYRFQGAALKPKAVRVMGRLGFPDDHPFLDHFRYLAATATHMPKMTIPSPSMLHYRGGRKLINMGVYPDLDAFYADLAAAYARAVRAFYGAGCRYLQLDDVSLAYLCDPEQRQMLRDRGDDPDRQLGIYRDVINAALEERPADMTVTTHLCRGNFRSTFVASGGYEPVAELLFNEIDVDGYFMEWDTDRAGGLEPLRFLPKGRKRVVLGFITSKSGDLEDRDAVERRIEEAARFAPLEQLALSPQCGFASTEEGNAIAEDEQWRKLALVVAIARETWADA